MSSRQTDVVSDSWPFNETFRCNSNKTEYTKYILYTKHNQLNLASIIINTKKNYQFPIITIRRERKLIYLILH